MEENEGREVGGRGEGVRVKHHTKEKNKYPLTHNSYQTNDMPKSLISYRMPILNEHSDRLHELYRLKLSNLYIHLVFHSSLRHFQ